MRKLTRWISVITLTSSLLWVGGCAMPSDRALYDIAASAVKADTRFPASGKIAPYANETVFPCKSAGVVRVAYSFTDETGVSRKATYTVWLKRVALTWVAERCNPTPTAESPTAQP